jgi:hypothetical protein
MDVRFNCYGVGESLRAQLLLECRAMVLFALSEGRDLPRSVRDDLSVLEPDAESVATLPRLADLYGRLARIVAPATPTGLLMMQEDKVRRPLLHFLGPVPSIRFLMVAMILFSFLFFGVSLFPEINRQTLSQDIYDMSGVPLLVALTFLLSAAGLGATFGVLFDASRRASLGSYDTKSDSIYWARIGLGLVSGLMLAELLPQHTPGGPLLERPLLALLGGFSASVVHQILRRFVGALESLFMPETGVDTAATERVIHQRVSEEQNVQRIALAKAFDGLLERIAAGATVNDARKGLVELLSGQAATDPVDDDHAPGEAAAAGAVGG